MPRLRILSRASRLLPAALMAVLALAAGPAARAGGARLDLVGACLDPGSGRIDVPLVLSGDEDLRPSGLRAVVAFDPFLLAPDETPVLAALPAAPAVVPGPVLGAAGVVLRARVDAEAGRIELLWHREGRLPAPPLPAGEVARVRLRLRAGVEPGAEPWIDLAPGETGAMDPDGRLAYVTAGPPVRPALPGTGPLLDLVQEGEATYIAAAPAAGSREAAPPVVILRGSLDRARPRGRHVTLGPLQRLPATADGLVAADTALPEPGGVFIYVAAALDATGRAGLGFGSDCRARQPDPGRAASR